MFTSLHQEDTRTNIAPNERLRVHGLHNNNDTHNQQHKHQHYNVVLVALYHLGLHSYMLISTYIKIHHSDQAIRSFEMATIAATLEVTASQFSIVIVLVMPPTFATDCINI